jgi:hypothetical protein
MLGTCNHCGFLFIRRRYLYVGQFTELYVSAVFYFEIGSASPLDFSGICDKGLAKFGPMKLKLVNRDVSFNTARSLPILFRDKGNRTRESKLNDDVSVRKKILHKRIQLTSLKHQKFLNLHR